MSVEIARRPVLRPAGNIVLLPCENGQSVMATARKPPPSPVKPNRIPKVSPPNSQPSTPRTSSAQARSPVLKPALSPRKPVPANPLSKPCAPPNAASISFTRTSSAYTAGAQHARNGDAKLPAKGDSNLAKAPVSLSSPSIPCEQRKPHISMNRSCADGFPRGNAKAKSRQNFGKIGSMSLDETSLANIVAAKKAAASDLYAQKKLRIAEYGRKPGKASRVAPEVSSLASVSSEPKRCRFITARSDPLYVAYHDEEWGVPIHDDRKLFELLVLAGAQVELSWNDILSKRDAYRIAFSSFEPAAVARFEEKHVQQLEADRSLLLPSGMIRGVVENARRILEVIEEHGSLDNYLWGFLNHKPFLHSYRYPKEIPVKTSKSESISKDLAKRGFRFVGPTIMYSFMQASGMTNDHLVDCFRHSECEKLSSSPQEAAEERREQNA